MLRVDPLPRGARIPQAQIVRWHAEPDAADRHHLRQRNVAQAHAGRSFIGRIVVALAVSAAFRRLASGAADGAASVRRSFRERKVRLLASAHAMSMACSPRVRQLRWQLANQLSQTLTTDLTRRLPQGNGKLAFDGQMLKDWGRGWAVMFVDGAGRHELTTAQGPRGALTFTIHHPGGGQHVIDLNQEGAVEHMAAALGMKPQRLARLSSVLHQGFYGIVEPVLYGRGPIAAAVNANADRVLPIGPHSSSVVVQIGESSETFQVNFDRERVQAFSTQAAGQDAGLVETDPDRTYVRSSYQVRIDSNNTAHVRPRDVQLHYRVALDR